MRAILALASKDLRLLFRDRVGFFFVFGFPLLYALLFGFIFKGAGGAANPIPILIVDDDQTDASRRLIDKLTQAPEVQVKPSTYDQAVTLVRKGQKAAYIRIPAGYGEAAGRPFWGGAPALELGVDPGRKAEAGLLQGVIMQYVSQDVFKVFSDPQAMREQTKLAMAEIEKDPSLSPVQRGVFAAFFAALDPFMTMVAGASDAEATEGGFGTKSWKPVDVQLKEVRFDRTQSEYPNNPMDITFPQSLVWGLMGCAASFGLSLVVERTRGTLVRLRLAPLARWHILAGKAVACFAMLIGVSVFLLLFAMLVFGVRPENYAHLAIGLLSAAVCFTGLMMMLSVAGRTEASAGGIGWAVLIVMAMLGGGMLPYFLMPPWMQALASVSPIKWTVLALEGAIYRGYSPADMLLPCGILIAVGVACFVAGSRLFVWMERT